MTFKICTDLYANPDIAPRLAVDKNKIWMPGSNIGIGFLGGSEIQKRKTREFGFEWLNWANLGFSFFDNPRTVLMCEVRIDFRRGEGSWSYMGLDALGIAETQPTMNFGWLYDETPDEEWSRTVIHEFGHMLGCIHEHQSPAAGIQWDKPLLYQYYWQTQGWSKEQVDFNIIRKYDRDISNTEFDRESIMLYPIEQRFTLDNFSVGWNRSLSDRDKGFIAEMYP